MCTLYGSVDRVNVRCRAAACTKDALRVVTNRDYKESHSQAGVIPTADRLIGLGDSGKVGALRQALVLKYCMPRGMRSYSRICWKR